MTERRVVRLLARYRAPNVEAFAERHAGDLASTGLFVRTESPLAIGTFVELECRGDGDEPLFAALARVVRTRELADARGEHPAGMALHFLRVDKAGERVLEIAERSIRFGLRFEADDRSWTAQQRASLTQSTPPPPPGVSMQDARIEVRVDGSLAPPAAEVERTPPLYAAVSSGDSAALKPGRVPAGFEGLVRGGSSPDSSEAVATPRSAIARPFLAGLTPEPRPAAAFAPPPARDEEVVPSDTAPNLGPRLEAVAASEATPPEGAVPPAPAAENAVAQEIRAREALPVGSDASAPVEAVPVPAKRKEGGSIAGLWIAAVAFLFGAAWFARWLAGEGP